MSALPQTAPARSRGAAADAPAAGARAGSRPSSGPTARRRPPLRVVPPRPRRSWVTVLIAFVVLGVLAVVALQAQAAGAAFTARSLEQEVTELQRRHEELTAEVAALESPERMRRVATTELGMVPAENPTYLDLTGGVRAAGWGSGPSTVADPVKQARTRR